MESTNIQKFRFGIQGHVSPGYEPVVHGLEHMFQIGHDKLSQLCVYVGNECVVDVYGKNGKAEQKSDFGPDTMTALMSSGKSVAAILMAIMVDQGHLEYDKPVVDYWPEFGQNGKDKITVRDVLCHEAGLHRLHKKPESEDLWPENIKKNAMGKIIETDTPIWPAGFRR